MEDLVSKSRERKEKKSSNRSRVGFFLKVNVQWGTKIQLDKVLTWCKQFSTESQKVAYHSPNMLTPLQEKKITWSCMQHKHTGEELGEICSWIPFSLSFAENRRQQIPICLHLIYKITTNKMNYTMYLSHWYIVINETNVWYKHHCYCCLCQKVEKECTFVSGFM